MTHERKVLDRVVERIMDLDSPAYGDERERVVSMESSSFGVTAGLYVGLLGALVTALFGLVLLPVALLVLAVLPAAAGWWYAKRRGVDTRQLADKAGARSTMIGIVVYGAAMVLAFAAMTYTVFTGHPVLPAPSPDVSPGEGFWGGMAQGAVVGGVLGGIAAIAGGVHSFRRANHRREAPGHR